MFDHLVMLCDYGLDDAIATCHIFENYKQFKKIDILAIAGNVSPAVSMRNLQTLTAHFELDERLTIVDTCDTTQKHENLYDIHGDDGMGGIIPPAKSNANCVTFRNWLKSYNGCDALLSLGPMTITETILKKCPPRLFVFMAGNIAEEPNYHGYEFNEGINPQAFSYCIGYPHKAVTLDTGTAPLDIIDKPAEGHSLKSLLVNRYRELTIQRREQHCYVWDDIAVSYLFAPSDFEEQVGTDKNGNVINNLIFKGHTNEG